GTSVIVLSLDVSLTCCTMYNPRRLNKNLISSYFKQDPRCPKPAVILRTKKSCHICVDPSLRWVEDIMKYLDNKRST
uniref:C-C motif chemokine n=1 Tax=Stegastes partitus TaxID=144197 RepID=A0A3B4ZX08_9TELE